MSLSHMMKKYSQENMSESLVHAHEVDMDGELQELDNEGLTASTDKVSHEIDNGLRDIDEVDSAIVAVEAYLDMLNARQKEGYALTEDVARVMRIGLEHISPGMFDNAVVSTEDVMEGEFLDGDDDLKGYGAKEIKSNDVATERTKSSLWEKLKAFFKAAANLLRRVINATFDYFNGLYANLDKLIARINDTAKASTILEGGHVMAASGIERLSVDGKYKGNDAKEYRTVMDTLNKVLYVNGKEAHDGFKAWHDEFGKMLSDKSLMLGIADPDSGKDEILGAISSLGKSFAQRVSKLRQGMDVIRDPKKVPGHIMRNNRIVTMYLNSGESRLDADKVSLKVPLKTTTMMGNKAYFIGLPTEAALVIGCLDFNCSFEVEPGLEGRYTSTQSEIKTMSAREAIDVLGQCRLMAEGLKEYRKTFEEIKNSAEKLSAINDDRVSKARSAYFKVSSGGSTNNLFEMYGLTMIVNNALRQIVETNWSLTGYAINICKTAIVLVEQMVKVEGKEVVNSTSTSPDRKALPAPSK